jgi:hypothetical protein
LRGSTDISGIAWKQVADELPGFTESMLTNLATGPLLGFPPPIESANG